ncbi:MAG: YdgA family protein, partial [Desulfobacteraceae bacterium]|nr:YdgA family protein [Desulfobacteraceae bacterium]
GISGDINTLISLDGFLVEDSTDVIDMMPGQIQISLDKGIKNIFAEMAWEGCSVSEKFNIDRLSFHSKLNRISKYIWDGEIIFEVNNIKASDIKEKMEISKLKCDYAMDYNMEEQSLSIEMGYSSDRILLAKDVIEKAFIQIGINHLDARGYESFMASYSQMMNSAIKAVAESHQDPALMKKVIERQMTGIGRQMLGAYEELLKKDFEIQISDFHAQLPEGKIEGDAIITFKKDVTMDKIIAIMIQPVTTLDIISLKSNISLPYILVGENPILLSPIYSGMQTGLFLKEGNNLVHKAETMNGKLFLNKKEVLLN